MALSIIFDDTSLFLTLAIVLLLSITIYLGKAYQPLVHPLILSRQADVSSIRYAGQSAIYRNANSPAGLELSSKPRRKINCIADVISSGSEAPRWSRETKRTFHDEQSSNVDILREARQIGEALASKYGLSTPAQLAVAVCVHVDSSSSIKMILSGCVQERLKTYTPLVIPPAHLQDGQAPLDFPAAFSARKLHAILTSSDALSSVLALPIVDNNTILIFASDEEAQAASASSSHKAVSFRQLVSQAGIYSEKLDEGQNTGDSMQSYYWTGKLGQWVAVTQSSLIGALTAHLGFFSAEAQPGLQDQIQILTSSTSNDKVGTSSPHLSAAYHPAGLVLSLLALYSAASISSSVIAQGQRSTEPTLIYASPSAASALAHSLCQHSKKHFLARSASNNLLAFLRSGSFNRHGFWDRMVFLHPRKAQAYHNVRSMMIINEGKGVSQGLLDVLRTHLACAVRQAYLPSHPSSAHGSELTSGVKIGSNISAAKGLITAPIASAHSLDLQAFTTDKGSFALTHVGPPNVTIEIKLVETQLAKERGLSISSNTVHVESSDPCGEIFVRGTSITGASDDKMWVSTGDLGSFRSNGTLVILHDQAGSKPVSEPTFYASKVARARSATSHGTSAISLMTLLLGLLCCIGVDASTLEARTGMSSYQLNKRASSSVNTTLVETAIMGFLAAPRASWEQGACQSSILEMYGASWSVFTASNRRGPPYLPQAQQTNAGGFPGTLMSMAYSSIQTQDSVGKLCSFVTGDEDGNGGSALDGASCGEAVLLAAFINGEIQNGAVINRAGMWATAARRQLNYMLNTAPRGPSGIISMRSANLAYWSDAMYMMPPFLSLYGLMTSNQSLVQEGYQQMSYYYDTLRIPSGQAQGLVRHIVNGGNSTSGNDNGAWLTGNAWAAAGMVKVIATIAQSPYANQMQPQIADLITWTTAILDGCYNFANPLIPNYVNETTTFRDSAGSALIAYSTYRLASLAPNNTQHIAAAEAIYSAVQDKLTPMGTFAESLDVPDALTFTSPAQMSPESLAFMVLLSSARRDYNQGNVTGSAGIGTGASASSSATSSAASSSTSPLHGWTTVMLICSLSSALVAFTIL